MYRVELYAQVRRSVFVEGISEREAAGRFGIARETVRKMLRYAAPPGYQRSKPVRRLKLDPYTGIIDQILENDREQPRKQRHTAKRIFDRLREEHGFDGGYSCVKEYVLQSHYLFADRFGRPGKGNDKGKVEGLVRYARRNFMVPIPHFQSWEAFNEHLERKCLERRGRRLRGHAETIGERFERDRQALLPLPATPYDACDKRSTRATSLSLVRYQTNDYSVPTSYGHREVWIKAYVDELVVCCGSEEIARHRRSYEREELIFDPLHYLALLERKTNALDQAAPLEGWELPEELTRLRRLLEVRLGKPGKREYVQVLRLLEDFSLEDVRAAAGQAVELGTISFDAVKHLLLCRIEQRPPRLDLSLYPHLPAAEVEQTSTADYLALLAGVG